MFTIRFETIDFRPNMLVTLRSEAKGWDNNIAGKYADDAWIFELSEADFADGMAFKMVLENIYWATGDDLFIQPTADQTYTYNQGQIQFPPLQEVRVENPAILRGEAVPSHKCSFSPTSTKIKFTMSSSLALGSVAASWPTSSPT